MFKVVFNCLSKSVPNKNQLGIFKTEALRFEVLQRIVRKLLDLTINVEDYVRGCKIGWTLHL
jgi:hypothetical protein